MAYYVVRTTPFSLPIGDTRASWSDSVLADSPSRRALDQAGSLSDAPESIVGERHLIGTYVVGTKLRFVNYTDNGEGLVESVDEVIQLENGATSAVSKVDPLNLSAEQRQLLKDAQAAYDADPTNIDSLETVLSDSLPDTSNVTQPFGGAISDKYLRQDTKQPYTAPTADPDADNSGTQVGATYTDQNGSDYTTYTFDGNGWVATDSASSGGYE